MTNWKEYRIKDISKKITSGGTPKSSEAKYYDGDIPWLNTKEIDFNRIIKTERCITNEGLNNSSAKWIPKGSVIVAMYGATAAKVAYTLIDLTTNQACCNLVINEELADSKFVYYFIQSSYEELLNLACGAAQQNLSLGVIADFPILLPSLDTQRRISSILSSLDDKIDLLHRENATMEQMAETLFRQWFVVEAKEEWEEKELREIVDISIGRTPPRKETKWFSTNPSDVKWLSIKDMGAGDVFLFNTSEYLTKEAVETFSIPIIPKNTVVLSFKMTVGRVGITTEDMLSNEAIAHFKFTNKTPITKEYLYLFLKSFKYDSLGSTSSIVTAINSAMIKQMQIIIPDEVIMKKFEEQTQYIFDKIYSNQKQIQTLIQMRDGLLPRLMSGEVKI